MPMQETSSAQQYASSGQIHGSPAPYEAFGRGSSSTSFSTGFGSTDKPRVTSFTKLQPWICSYCANRNSAAQDTRWKCSRCGNDRMGVPRY